MVEVRDMPKLESPFVREMVNGQYVVTSVINPEMEWVFKDESVICTEKLDGTNVSIIVENGVITSIWNRTNRIPFFCKGKSFIIEGLLESFERGYCELQDGQWFGELIGPRVNGNPYKLKKHLWIPFKTYAKEHLMYKSWGKYPKDFQTISEWLKVDIFSLYMRRTVDEKIFPEGIVFVQPSTGKMAKLRRDMFPWAKEVGLNPHKSLSDKLPEVAP